MKHRQTSFAFLMEMLWVCGFFILSACIFLLAFIKAHQISIDARNLNQAVLYTENAIETSFASYRSGEEEEIFYFDRVWNAADENHADMKFYIIVSTELSEDMLTVSAEAFKKDGELIYALDGARYLPD